MTANDILFSILRAEICGVEIDKNVANLIDDDLLKKLYLTAKKHDMVHIVALWLSKSRISMLSKAQDYFLSKFVFAIRRYEQMNKDYECICKILEEEKIPYIPLKGAVIRDFYPEPWMRTSCDIDILVKEEDLERAAKAISEKLSFKSDGSRDYHDISMFSESCTHLELHFNIKENMENIDGVLSDVWKYSQSDTDGGYRYKMTNEFLLFHIVSHMAYHVKCGGCGIRAFIDLYLLENNLSYDESKLLCLCEKCSIDTFRKAVEKLSAVWMGQQEHDELSKQLEEFILDGGLYGDIESAAAIKQTKNGGRTKYLLTLVFQPYEVLKEKYPVLKKHKWLIPFYQMKRWCKLAVTERGRYAGCYLKAGKSFTESEIDKKVKLFKVLELY